MIMCPSTPGNKPRAGTRPLTARPPWIAKAVLATIDSHSHAADGSLRRVEMPLTARRSDTMKNPLDSLWGTIISGLVLTVILYFVVKSILVG
jgi:hypothetical protein